MRDRLGRIIKKAYKALPVSTRTQLRVKAAIFRALGPLISETTAYRAWEAQRGSHGGRRRLHPTGDPSTRIAATNSTLASGRSPDHVEFIERPMPTGLRAKAIAFYLPQFHPIAENDRWWGKGFTEWRNVTRTVPQFDGHYQPHLPADLGFYDLRVAEILSEQVDLAKRYGIGAFCFYFYWFGGTRLLESPIEQFLRRKDLDLEFCLCWANENWTRRWDGDDQEVLIKQSHSDQDDLAFISHLSRYLRDPRYIRVDGRPLLIIYRPDLLPDATLTAQRWRDWCRTNDLGEIHLAYVQTFEKVDPALYHFDSAIEFPPNNSDPVDITEAVTSKSDDFRGRIYDWKELARRSRDYRTVDYTLFRGVNPSWDNEARKPQRGTIFAGSNPADYGEWLELAITDTERRFANASQRLVFINAWNEWAEGAHLEPDLRYGHAWLAATRAALTGKMLTRKLVLVSHDAHPHGAQHLALALARTLSRDFGMTLAIVVLGPGALIARFAELGEVFDLSDQKIPGRTAEGVVKQLSAGGYRHALINTTVSGRFLGLLAVQNFHCVSLIHEMPGVLRQYELKAHADDIARHAAKVVFPSRICADAFVQFAPIPGDRVLVRPQGAYRTNAFRFDRGGARREIVTRLDLAPDLPIVLGVGFADERKGVDWFIEAALILLRKQVRATFVWLGNWDKSMREQVDVTLVDSGLQASFRFPGFADEPDAFYAASDVYALSSREDPFPSVVLESLAVGVPVVGFESAGGFEDLLKRDTGVLVPFGDTAAFASAIQGLIEDPLRRRQLGENGARIVETELSFRRYAFDLLDLAHQPRPRVSVVVPNYNYARYMRKRLESVAAQSCPLLEIIVLDDASTDNSLEVIHQTVRNFDVPVRVIANSQNSGSVFKQWRKGVELAQGDFVWIAEADDLSAPTFLARTLEAFDDPEVLLSYCESRQIDEDGGELAPDYADYVKDISATQWRTPYARTAAVEVEEALSTMNTIPNVSAVVFRRAALLDVLNNDFPHISSFRVAGDWATYLALLSNGGSVAFHAEALNQHRRHASGVTISSFGKSQWLEIRRLQLEARQHFTLSAQACARADHYAQQLYEQFGLASSKHPRFSDHPELGIDPLHPGV